MASVVGGRSATTVAPGPATKLALPRPLSTAVCLASSLMSNTSTVSPCSSGGICSSRLSPYGYASRKPGVTSTSPEATNDSPFTSSSSLVFSMVAGPISVARKRRAMRS